MKNLCTLKKVSSEAEAQDFIKSTKKEFWDATHNCSAYIINDMQQRSSDDGEPSGTAGIPMLEVLRKKNLIGVAAVVTRYFGGIKQRCQRRGSSRPCAPRGNDGVQFKRAAG